uniref:Uncharacterized protein n=1 Tax=Entomoneis paludosa TaxID=265537 RepID=A0A7S2Y5G7_9STRA
MSKDPPRVVATDNFSWAIANRSKVEKLSYQQAVEKYCRGDSSKHVIVICSWMPMGEDWSKVFRQNMVDEYILIGECDDGQCGDNWATWGNVHMLSADVSEEIQHNMEKRSEPFQPPQETAPYKLDGYTRKNLDTLRPYQLSRYDNALSKLGRTVSFRRGGKD